MLPFTCVGFQLFGNCRHPFDQTVDALHGNNSLIRAFARNQSPHPARQVFIAASG
jgi:hypothetical protein